MTVIISDMLPGGTAGLIQPATGDAATGGDARQLVGYLVSDSGLPLDTAALKARLAEQLPPHMVPVVLMQLAELPLSANGKLDRKALPLPTLGGERSGRPPEPGMETLVAAAFSQLLGCEVNDIDADFFALGGHSLLAMRLAAQLSRQLARQVTPGQVMVASTVGKLSALLAADLSDEQARRLGLDTLLPPGSSACWRAISARAGRLPVFSRRARRGRWPAPPASTRCASIICARCWRSSRTALITCSGIRWAAP
jgi:hypothetical protein